MYDEHARALKYFAWFAAGLFPLGIILEDMKQTQPAPVAVYALLVLIGLLCHANMYGAWKSDKAIPATRRKRK